MKEMLEAQPRWSPEGRKPTACRLRIFLIAELHCTSKQEAISDVKMIIEECWLYICKIFIEFRNRQKLDKIGL